MRTHLHSALSLLLLLALCAQGPVLRGSVSLLASSHGPALPPGSHCPLKLTTSHHDHSSDHDCPMHQRTVRTGAEFRCHCPTSAPATAAEFASPRFVLPLTVVLPLLNASTVAPRGKSPFLLTRAFTPPDPPPRLSFSPSI
ncbi:MAG: hypothetical protein HOP18_00120 [Deltaproteobacteria bacterium]|nr:hypothetical protein [Deltaproteobacteria bacterium]